MDGLFVARKPREGAQKRDRESARQIVEAMAQEIVLDEVGSGLAEATPDQRRFVDSLFSRRKGEDSEVMQTEDSSKEGGLAETLFARRGEEVDSDSESAKDSDGEPEQEAKEADRSASASEVLSPPGANLRQIESEATRAKASRPRFHMHLQLTDLLRVTRLCMPLLAGAALVSLITAALAMGCEESPLLGRFCIVEGPAQLAVAFAPLLLALIGLAYWLRQRRMRQQHAAERSWRQDAEAQRSAAELLDALLDSPPAEISKYSQQVLQIIQDFPEKAVIQHKGWLAVEAVCRAQKGNAAQMQAAGAVPILLQALEEHRRVRQVQRAALDALSCMAKVARQQIFDLGGIPSVLAAMTKFRRDPDVQVSGALVLGGLCMNSDSCRHSVVKYGGVNVLTAALDRHEQRPDVLIAAAETLALLASGRHADILQRMMPSLPMVQAMVIKHSEAEGSEAKVVLRSLQKLEAQLLGSTKKEDDEWSDAGTPRQNAQKAVVRSAQDEVKQVAELHDRFKRWNDRRK
ncbi:unnamed protein product [Effrenium voratum]|nr:unnamed protein product [Effrenium voratum]